MTFTLRTPLFGRRSDHWMVGVAPVHGLKDVLPGPKSTRAPGWMMRGKG